MTSIQLLARVRERRERVESFRVHAVDRAMAAAYEWIQGTNTMTTVHAAIHAAETHAETLTAADEEVRLLEERIRLESKEHTP